MAKHALPTREQVAREDTWDLTPIFANDQAWEQEFVSITKLVTKATDYKGTLGENPENLLAALLYRDELFARLNRLYVYAHLQEDTDTRNSVYQSLCARAATLGTQGQAAFSYFKAEIKALPEAMLRDYLKSSEELAIYTQEFEELFLQRQYILSQREEEILAKASEPLASASNTYALLSNADLEFPVIQDENGQDVQLSHGSYVKLLESTDKRVRHDAFKGMFASYFALQNTMASTLNGAIKADNFRADIRGYRSARHAAMAENVIPETVFDSLISAVNNKLPALHRYVDLRKKRLGLETINMYDMYVPIVDEVKLSFTFAEAKEIAIDALGILGTEYQDILRMAFDQRWIDPVENKGKRSGAYSSGTYGTYPYILMNWQDNLDNLYTLVHELGHSVHSYYSRSNQPFVYSNYSIFLAEIASTTNEILLTEYLLGKYSDPKIKAYVINHYLDGVKGTVYRQTQFAEFEHLIHTADSQGTPLTADFLSEQYDALNKKYYGPAVTYDPEIALEWARIPHFYYDYYVYQYATGFSAASAFSRKILDQGQSAIDAYLNFLKMGTSDFPIEVLKKAGLDMTTNQPVVDALATFEHRLEQLEGLLE